MTADDQAAVSRPSRRPVVVTISVVVIYTTAFANVLLGILVLLSRYQVPRDDVLPISLLGAAIILFGLLLVAVASGVARGSRFSRILATLWLGILIVLNTITIVTTDGWDWSTTVQLVVAVLVVVALWAPPGARHFVAAPKAADAGSP